MGEDAFVDKVTRLSLNVASIGGAVLVAFVFLFGAYDFFKGHPTNQCKMSFMYEYPYSIKISLGEQTDKMYPMYALYAYDETGVIGKYDGMPVLFIPGNAGSHRQVRSIASTAHWRGIHKGYTYRFDFYAVDFNDEFSGLYGNVLNRQLDYSRKALAHIMSLYKTFHHVVVMGHSMGGLIAKTINTDEIKSHLIFTLATPHARPAMILDPNFDLFYYYGQNNFTKIQSKELKTTVVSVSGGESDLLVADKLTLSPTNDFQTSTTSVPSTWLSVDHLCILWCNQFVLVVIRILVDLVEFQNKSDNDEDNGYMGITKNQTVINSVLAYHLKKKSSGTSYFTKYANDFPSKPGVGVASWVESHAYEYCSRNKNDFSYVMFPMHIISKHVKGNPGLYGFTAIIRNMPESNWLYGCITQDVHQNVTYCSEMDNLTPFGEILPNQQKVAHLDYDRIRNYSHILVKLVEDSPRTCVNWEVNDYSQEQDSLSVNSFHTENRIFFNFSLNSWMRRATAWRLSAEVPQGNGSTCQQKIEKSLAIFRHDNFQTHHLIGNVTYGGLIIRFANWSAEKANVLLYMEPNCNYKISVKVAYLETAGQLFRTYFSILPAYLASMFLLSIFFQCDQGKWENIHSVLLKNAFNLTFMSGGIVGWLLTFVPSDYLKVMDKNEVSVFLPLFCYLGAFAVVLVAGIGLWYIVVCTGHAVQAFFYKYLTRRLGLETILIKMTDSVSEFTFAKTPIFVSVLLIALSSATCGGLGICVGVCLYFIKICKMYGDILDDVSKEKVPSIQEGASPLNFHLTVASLWLVVAVLNIPSVLFWKNNVGYGESQQQDMSLYLSLILTPALAILWQDFAPKNYSRTWTFQRYLSYFIGIFVVMWGTHRVYLISVFITLYLVTLALTQLHSSIANFDSTAANKQHDDQQQLNPEASRNECPSESDQQTTEKLDSGINNSSIQSESKEVQN